MNKGLTPLLRRIVGGVIEMTKTIEFWAVFLGFALGIAYNLLDKIFNRAEGATVLEVMLTWEYRAIVIVIAGVLLLSIVFYFVERNTKEGGKCRNYVKRFGIILMAAQSLSYLPQEGISLMHIIPMYPQAHASGRDAISAG